MPQVSIFISRNGEAVSPLAMDEATVKQHSKTIRKALEGQPNGRAKRAFVKGRAPAEIRTVLILMGQLRGRLHINVGQYPIPKAIAIFQAINLLEVEPPQTWVRGQILGRLRRSKLTPEDMRAVHLAFGEQGEQDPCWKAMVNKMGGWFAHKLYTAEEEQAIINESEQHPDLDAAIIAKQEELEQREAARAQREAEWAQREAARKRKEEQKARQAEYKQRIADRDEQRQWEESQGLRTTSEKTVNGMMADVGFRWK